MPLSDLVQNLGSSLSDVLSRPVPRDPNYVYGSILPFRKPRAGGSAEWHPMYSELVGGLMDALTAPGRALQGQQMDVRDALNVGLGALGAGGAAPRMGPGGLGANVWHGSPHRFPPTPANPLGEFSARAIGSGEGAQAKGYGHYVADRSGIATEYKPGVNRLRQDAPKEGGHLYKVDLEDSAIGRMIDSDAALSKQPSTVQVALRNLDHPIVKRAIEGDWTGNKLIKSLEAALSREQQVVGMPAGVTERVGGPEEVARMLREAGIPGARYLDAASRASGAGTSNYVIFPGGEDLLRILERR